jgi:hypothetical protein
MFSKIRTALPANRIAAIVAVLIGLGTIITTFVADSGLAGTKVGDAVVAGVGLLGSLVLILKTVDKFLEGAQNWDSLMVAGVPKVSNAPVAALPSPQGDLTDAPLGATDGDAEAPTNIGAVINVVEPDPEV